MTDEERQAFEDLLDTMKIGLRDVPIPILLNMVRARVHSVLGRPFGRVPVSELLNDPERGPLLRQHFELMRLDPEPHIAEAARALWAALEAEP